MVGYNAEKQTKPRRIVVAILRLISTLLRVFDCQYLPILHFHQDNEQMKDTQPL
ncbi:MAG: hypothetical protein IJX51_01710 [Clostridia bacterium]|nr:hypothetical protein [Clostridia bacterium]